MGLCGPAIVYLVFSATQVLVDFYRTMYNTAFVKVLVTVLLTFTLQVLCEMNLSMVAWMIVFIPFITMSIYTFLLLFVFGKASLTGSGTSQTFYPAAPSTDETVVTPDGINQPYQDGQEVKPGTYVTQST